jgi:hypothetical protein
MKLAIAIASFGITATWCLVAQTKIDFQSTANSDVQQATDAPPKGIIVEQFDAARTNQAHFVSHSKTVEAYRQLYPQLTNMDDERLVLAIGAKQPDFLKTDSVLSNEFADCSQKFPALPNNNNHPVRVSEITNITTLDGETYTGVKIIKVEPDGLLISYAIAQPGISMTKLSFENLPDSLKERFHYDPSQAVYFQQRRAQAMSELRQKLTAQHEIAVNAENQRIAEGLKQRQIEQEQKIAAADAQAAQKRADAEMIQALKPPPPPPEVNVIQQNVNNGWY